MKLNSCVCVEVIEGGAGRGRVVASVRQRINKLLGQEPMIVRLALLMKVRGLKTTEELDAALRELGTSLERQVDDFGEQMMGMEAVRRSLSKITDRSKRQEAGQQVLNRIRAATAVWTIYDDPS